ncbi:ATP-binding protein [Phycicoccus sonneratiae]|uniref:ATP-binding protein n=1 Tax=Phycicoccus sonneratiae TaxID=2807628 RepID=A0ABS2CK70_9MICO|nr:ATP-binding protein [Phycicoccus sonneraticus]MBM6400279.1 ATP-binding protein [Phycicoccus sonneraticus]
MSSRQHVVVAPDTRRMVEGLRDTGYTFNAALADLIDNSIAADATRVSVYLGWTTDRDIILTVADDGHGMTTNGLKDAMRYGAPERPSRSSLGRFGLGLKTASTGFCRRLTVMSRNAGSSPLSAAVWDLDDLVRAGEWNLDLGPADEGEEALWEDSVAELHAIADEEVGAGTVVLWQKVDKLLKTASGAPAKNLDLALSKTEDKLRDHLRLVFQRYLNPNDKRARNVSIAVNGVVLEAWDPFLEGRGGNCVLEKTLKMRPAYSGAEMEEYNISLRAFILPRKDEYSSDETRDYANIGLDRQGIYLYREERMIEGPDWLGTGATETHLNTLRVELSFPAQLDEVMGVGIKKSGVHIDPQLIALLKDLLAPVRREADRLSRKGRATTAESSVSPNSSRPTERTIARLKGNLTVPKVESDSNGAVSLVNNSGQVVLRDGTGKASGIVAIAVDADDLGLNVVRDASLDDGALWEARLARSNIQVAINTGHQWYRKAYLPYAGDNNMVQAIEYLFYALAQAEMNNTDVKAHETFEEFRIEVSRNLKKLVKDLAEPDDD